MKNKLLRALALSGILFSGCATIIPKTGFEVAFVPERINGKSYSKELMTDASFSAQIPIDPVLSFNVGGNLRTFIQPGFPLMKKINWQEYGISGSADFDLNKYLRFSVFAYHLCSHLVDEASYTITDTVYNDSVLFGLDSVTKIGFKIETKLK
jgi:hypothetical protein